MPYGDSSTTSSENSRQPKLSTSIFSSKRERRLWASTIALMVAIYSTLGLAGRLADVLRARGLLDATFAVSMIIIGVTIIILALKVRPRGIEIGAMLGVGIAYIMVIVRMGIPIIERTHLIEYGVVGAFVYEALQERASQDRRVPMPALLAIGATALLGSLDECIQVFLPNRVFDPRDILFNILAGSMAVVASAAIGWVHRQRITRAD